MLLHQALSNKTFCLKAFCLIQCLASLTERYILPLFNLPETHRLLTAFSNSPFHKPVSLNLLLTCLPAFKLTAECLLLLAHTITLILIYKMFQQMSFEVLSRAFARYCRSCDMTADLHRKIVHLKRRTHESYSWGTYFLEVCLLSYQQDSVFSQLKPVF